MSYKFTAKDGTEKTFELAKPVARRREQFRLLTTENERDLAEAKEKLKAATSKDEAMRLTSEQCAIDTKFYREIVPVMLTPSTDDLDFDELDEVEALRAVTDFFKRYNLT